MGKADNTRRRGCIGFAAYMLLLLLGAASLLWGCSGTRYVPVETVRTEYRDREVERLVSDTVHDTRLVWIKGDTVLDIREKERVRRVETHDTVEVVMTDTIREPYPVERKLTRWQQAKIDYGGEAIVALVVTLIAAVVWLIRKFRK